MEFKFFKENKIKVFSEWLDRLDDYHLGGIEEPPQQLSRRHWNLLPQDLKRGALLDMLTFISGWESARRNESINPVNNSIHLREIWNRGFMLYQNRTRNLSNERI